MLLCCGESLIDMLPRETRAGEAAFAPYSGGAVLNTAIAAARLGQKTAMLTGLSRDLFGQILEGHLAGNHVCRLKVGFKHGVGKIALTHVAAGVDVDGG